MSSISSPPSRVSLMLLHATFMTLLIAASASNFYRDFNITWGANHANVRNGGQLLTLSLDKLSGSGIRSNNQYIFGRIDMQIKLVPGNSAGTVTSFYFSSEGPTHDEIDFEFLGNLSGQPYVLHTNVFSQGKGDREQEFYLWFDPAKNFHTYSIVWNINMIVLLVDNIPIRVFQNLESIGVPFPKSQPMKIYSSIWNGDTWATRGGLIKIDWTKAPFTAMYRNFVANACVRLAQACDSMATFLLDAKARRQLHWVKKNFMIYNYCTDLKKFPKGFPPECSGLRF